MGNTRLPVHKLTRCEQWDGGSRGRPGMSWLSNSSLSPTPRHVTDSFSLTFFLPLILFPYIFFSISRSYCRARMPSQHIKTSAMVDLIWAISYTFIEFQSAGINFFFPNVLFQAKKFIYIYIIYGGVDKSSLCTQWRTSCVNTLGRPKSSAHFCTTSTFFSRASDPPQPFFHPSPLSQSLQLFRHINTWTFTYLTWRCWFNFIDFFFFNLVWYSTCNDWGGWLVHTYMYIHIIHIYIIYTEKRATLGAFPITYYRVRLPGAGPGPAVSLRASLNHISRLTTLLPPV